MRTRFKSFSLIPVALLALAMMLPAEAVSAQTAASHGDDLAGKLARREVQRSPSSIPGREIVQVETLIPAGIESGWPAHPREADGYTIAGHGAMVVQGPANGVLHPREG